MLLEQEAERVAEQERLEEKAAEDKEWANRLAALHGRTEPASSIRKHVAPVCTTDEAAQARLQRKGADSNF